MTADSSAAPMRIRAARAGDAAALARLLDALGYPARAEDLPARLERLANDDNAVLVAADERDEPMGLLAIHRTPVLHAPTSVAHITALVTSPEERGRGVGRRLLHAAEEWARARGCVRLTVTSAERRDDAHAFYPACGMPYTGRRFSKPLT